MIIFYIPTLHVGGAERQFAKIARLVESKQESMLILHYPNNDNLNEEVPKNTLALFKRVPRYKIIKLIQLMIAPLLLRRIISKLPDRKVIIYSALYMANISSVIASCYQRNNITNIWGIRSSDYSDIPNGLRLLRYFAKLLSTNADLCISNSDTGKGDHKKLGFRPKKWITIPNIISHEAKRVNEDHFYSDTLNICMLSRVVPFKNHLFAIQGFEIAQRLTSKRLRLTIAGSGNESYVESLKTYVMKKKIKNVTFIGQVYDPMAFLTKHSVYVLSSNGGEGFPNSLGEAMSCGLICTSSDCGDAEKIIGDKEMIFSLKDPKHLANILVRIAMMTPEELVFTSKKNVKRTKALFHEQVVLDQYVEYLRVKNG